MHMKGDYPSPPLIGANCGRPGPPIVDCKGFRELTIKKKENDISRYLESELWEDSSVTCGRNRLSPSELRLNSEILIPPPCPTQK